jgi:hypothetical protein
LSNHKRARAEGETKEEAALKAQFQSYLERANAGIDLNEMKASALQ